MVAGGSLCSGSGWSQATTPSDEKRQGRLAAPVRALIRRNGALFQPVEITLDNHGAGSVAITRVEGQEVDRRMAQPGSNEQSLGNKLPSLPGRTGDIPLRDPATRKA
jgi:hypothetical protein